MAHAVNIQYIQLYSPYNTVAIENKHNKTKAANIYLRK